MIKIHFATYDKLRWFWRPHFIRSQVIFRKKDKVWLAPIYEFSFGPFVFNIALYSLKKEYHGEFAEHECPAELTQDRLNELEEAIRTHRDQIGYTKSMYVDRQLWKILDNK